MKKLLSIFLLLLALSGSAQTNINVIYSFLNGLNQNQRVVQVSFTPMSLGIYSNAFVIGDENYRVVSGARLTNQMISGFAYRVKYFRQKDPDIITSVFTNWFPTNVSGTVYATDYVAISTNIGNGIYAYSMAQSDARFAPIGGGSGGVTNAGGVLAGVLTNATFSATGSNNIQGVVTGMGTLTNFQATVNLPAAIITNSAQLSGLIRNHGIKLIQVLGDSQSMSGGTGGSYSYGGRTNSSTPSAATNQPDGTILYTPSTFSATVKSWANILTNQMAQQGVYVALDTAMSMGGQLAANIWGYGLNGKVTWSSNCIYAGQDFTTKVYGSTGVTNLASAAYSGGTLTQTWHPWTNDYSITFTNSANEVITALNTNNQPISWIPKSGFSGIIVSGRPNANIQFQIGSDIFSGYQFAYMPPWTNNGNVNNTTNNISPIVWANTNNLIYGSNSIASFVFLGNNDITARFKKPEMVHIIQSNKIAMMSYLKSRGNYVYLITTPQNPNTIASSPNLYGYSLSNLWSVMHADEMNTPSTVCDGIIDLYGILRSSGADNTGANYIDGTHPKPSFSTNWSEYVYSGLDFGSLLPTAYGQIMLRATNTPVNGYALRFTNGNFYWAP